MKKQRKLPAKLIGLIIILAIINISCDKDVSVNPPDKPIPLGKVYLDSKPQGAKIYFNNEDIGRVTPDSICYIQEGVHSLTLKLSDYRDSTFVININETSPLKMLVDFTQNEAMKSTINCKSTTKGCEIYINGKFTGKYTTDTVKSLLPGTYRIMYKKTGFWEDSTLISIKSGGLYTVDFALRDTSLWVTFDKSHKLPTDFINCVYVDQHDTKWIGTNDQGLIKFDGINATVYNTKNSGLPENCIKSIVSDQYGNLWIGTLYGIAKFDGRNWTNYNTSNSPIPSNHIIKLAIEQNGTLWIATYNKGAASFNGSVWKTYDNANSGLYDNYIKTITIDSKGNKWVGTTFSGVFKFDGNSWKSYKIPLSRFIRLIPVNEYTKDTLYYSNNISSILVQENGEMFVSLDKQSDNGRAKYQEAMLYYPSSDDAGKFYSASFSGGSIWGASSIIQDKNGVKWITSPEGIFMVTGSQSLAGKKFDVYNAPIRDNNVNTIAVDKSGNKWISSLIGGVIKYKGDK